MSIKQENGFLFTTTDLICIYSQVKEYKKKLEEYYRDCLYSFVAQMAVSKHDYHILREAPVWTELGYLQSVYNTIYALPDKITEASKILNPETILYVIPRNNKLLGIINPQDRNEVQEMWVTDNPIVEKYGIVTATDKPEGISEEEWHKRFKDWNFNGIYSELAFAITCHSRSPDYFSLLKDLVQENFDAFRKHYPSEEERVKKLRKYAPEGRKIKINRKPFT